MSKRPKATGHRSRDSPPISRAGRSGFTGLFFLFLFFSFFFFFFRFFSFDFLLVSFGCFFVCCSSIFLFFSFYVWTPPVRRGGDSLSTGFTGFVYFFYLVFSFFHFFLYCQGSCRLSSRFRLGLVVVVVVFFVIWNGPLMRSRLLLSTMKNAARGKKQTNKTNNNKTKENLKRTKIEASVSRQRSISGSRCFYWVLPSFFVISFFFRTTPRNNNDDDDNIVDG